MLAVAPRGRLSWIPNISGARMLRASLLQLSRKNKKKKKKQKKSSRKNVIYRTERGFWTGDIFFTRTSRSKTRRRGRRKTSSLKFCRTFRLICRFNSTFQGRNFFKFLRRFFFYSWSSVTEKKAGGGGNEKREIKSSEDEKTRGRTAGSGRRIKQSVFFLFPKERRREEVGWDGGVRSGGETLSPAAPQDWTAKPKNPTGLPPCCWRHHGGGGAWPYKDRRGERRCVCAGVREQDEEREEGEEGEEVPTNQSQRERSWSPHALALSLSQSELVPVYPITSCGCGENPLRDPVLVVLGLLSDPEPGQRVPDGLCGSSSGQTEAERPDRVQTLVQEVKVELFLTLIQNLNSSHQGLVLVPLQDQVPSSCF